MTLLHETKQYANLMHKVTEEHCLINFTSIIFSNMAKCHGEKAKSLPLLQNMMYIQNDDAVNLVDKASVFSFGLHTHNHAI